MNLKTAQKKTQDTLKGKQDPDKVIYTKQWDEFGALKGWIVECAWDKEKNVMLDMTSHYTRIVGDLDEVPEYIKGKHQIINLGE